MNGNVETLPPELARHEAGHAVVDYLLGIPIREVEFETFDEAGVRYDSVVYDSSPLALQVICLWAGFAGEALEEGFSPRYWQEDNDSLRQTEADLALRLCKMRGCLDHEAACSDCGKDARAWMRNIKGIAPELLKAHRVVVLELAQRLWKGQPLRLKGAEVAEFMESRGLQQGQARHEVIALSSRYDRLLSPKN